jgi:hypothetical protein
MFGHSIGSSEIDGYYHVQLKSSSEIVDEGGSLIALEVLEDQFSWFF